ncbi:MAG: nucleoside triphosphate pyrophosphohydrolase [Pseudomonadota bacterium]
MDTIKPPATRATIDTLAELVRLLRSEKGCPWDQKQTPETIKKYLIEEAYEVMEAMEDGSPTQVCGELGDLLFQLVFLACLYEAEGAFSIQDVVRVVTEKMIRRHPHVFGDKEVRDAEEVKANWHKIKLTEKGTRESKSPLDSVPRNLPALMRAHRITERAARSGFVFPDVSGIFTEVDNTISKLKKSAEENKEETISEEFGDLLLKMVVLGRLLGVHSETALDQALQRFVKKFRRKM